MRWMIFGLTVLCVCLLGTSPTFLPGGDSTVIYPGSWSALAPSHFMLIDELATGGNTCAQQKTALDTWIASNDCPTIITMMCGINDCITDTCEDAAEIALVVAQVDAIAAAAVACGAKPIIMTPTAIGSCYAGDANRITELDALADAIIVSGAANGYMVVDINQAFYDYDAVSGQEMDDLYYGDCYHPDFAGDALIARTMEPVLEALYPPKNPKLLE